MNICITISINKFFQRISATVQTVEYNEATYAKTSSLLDANGTITICKTIQSLKPGRKYKIDYFVDYLYGDDFDVGFGDDQIGPLCWLRGSGGYGITSKGIYLNSQSCSNSDVKITNNIKKISFIVDLLNYTSEIYLDNTKVYSNFSINSNLTYYPMAAIRQLNNSVKLDVTELN